MSNIFRKGHYGMHQGSNPQTMKELWEDTYPRKKKRNFYKDDVDCVVASDFVREEFDDDDADCFCD